MSERSTARKSTTITTEKLLALWGLTAAAAYLGFGPFLDQRAEGIDIALISKVGPAVAVALALLALAATVAWARQPIARPATASGEQRIGRRGFLRGGAVALGGLGASAGAIAVALRGWLTVTVPAVVRPQVVETDPTPRDEWRGARIAAFRRLGRTDFRVSDIALGCGALEMTGKSEDIARAAIERGVNYFDTSPDYSASGSELALGKAMEGHRDDMFVATKFCTPDGHLPAGSSVSAYMEAVEASLRRLQTDYVDLVHIHSCDKVERLMDPNVHEAFDRLREQGKARFLGVSTHTPDLETIADTAIDSGRFDVMMLAYHHGAWPGLAKIIDRAAERDIGVVAMKTLKGAKHTGVEGFRGEGDAYSQAAFKWVLSNPSVSCLVVSFFEHQHVDEYLYASGQSLTQRDVALLDRYDRLTGSEYCRPHCGDCLDHCPEGLPINDILRYRMYFEDYGREKYAMQAYAELHSNASACLGCSAPCAGTCPHDLAIRERMLGAHARLSMTA